MSWNPDLSGAQGPIYRAIAMRLASDVASGKLPAGAKLPPQRELARSLGVDLTTVTRAFAEAASNGLIVAEGRRGTFVRMPPPADHPDSSPIEAASGMNMPPEPEDGSLQRRIAEGVAAIMKEAAPPLHYQPAGGTEAQRAAAALFHSHLIPGTSADQCVITAGSQHALFAALSILANPGERVATGCLTYPGFLAAARRLGLDLVPLPMDSGGIDPDALEAAARSQPIKLLYVVPTNDNPTTATLPLARRKAIVGLARRHGFAIVEDDAYGRLPAQPVQPIASLAPDLTWHIATVSKLISPSLRVGLVRVPTVRDALALASAIHDTAGMPPPVNATLISRWIEDGTFLRLLASIRAEAAVRAEAAGRILEAWGPKWHPDGYHLWLPVPGDIAADAIALQAVSAGLPAVSGSAFAVDANGGEGGLRISLGGSGSRARLRRELERLDALLARAARSTLV